jgi:hypothetical protein
VRTQAEGVGEEGVAPEFEAGVVRALFEADAVDGGDVDAVGDAAWLRWMRPPGVELGGAVLPSRPGASRWRWGRRECWHLAGP